MADSFDKIMATNLNFVDFLYQVITSNSNGNYMIGVLSLITLALWLLLALKRRFLSRDRGKRVQLNPANNSEAANSAATSAKAGISGQVSSALSNQHQSMEDDGHLSDSALSFFKKFGTKSGPRFRKRDKLFFYGKKMLRNISHVRGSISARSAEKSRKIYKILSKK